MIAYSSGSVVKARGREWVVIPEITGQSTYSKENKGSSGVSAETLKVLNQVILMTPENIHINSFMYEPLMDMSNHHLVTLYKDVKVLAWS